MTFEVVLVLEFDAFSLSVSLQHLVKGVHYRWGLFAPSGPALDEVREMVDAGQVQDHI